MRRFFVFALVFVSMVVSGAGRAMAHLPPTLSGETFVIDAGHGTRHADGSPLNVGAVGPHGVQEAKVTLAVAEDVAALLRAYRGKVVLTRSYAQPCRVATAIAPDNHARAALANRIGATAFIAIHADSSLSPASHGTSVFWLRPNSVRLANEMRRDLARLGLGESEFRPRHLAVTDEATVPAVLVELGFVSNPAQERLLAAPQFQQREAHEIFDAIISTFGHF
jgi:N-acetylmuramoyl-L-alanine amidase